MVYNYSKLLGKIKEMGFTQNELSNLIGKNKSTLNAKLNGKGNFTVPEMDAICEVLDIPNEEIGAYFFAK
jgi:transcriptional regulator with XRE-family HTH domain